MQSNSTFVARHIEALKTDAQTSSTREKVLACFALGFCSDPAVLPILVRNMEDVSPLVRANSAASTGLLMYRKVISQEQAPFAAYRKMLGSRAWEDNASALYALRFILTPGQDMGFSDVVTPLFKHPMAEVRLEAVSLAAILEHSALYDPVRALMDDPEVFIRMNAVKAVARIGKQKSIPDLVRAMASQVDDIVKVAVLQLDRLAPKGLEYACDVDGHAQPAAGNCPRCHKPLTPRAKQ
jgi:HEAT repeat protein